MIVDRTVEGETIGESDLRTLDWAADRGYSILMDPHSSGAEIGAKHRHYTERLLAAGFSEAMRDVPIARLVAIADNPNQRYLKFRSQPIWASWSVG